MGPCSSTGLRLPVTGLPQLLGWVRGPGWDEKLSLELKPNEGKEAQNSKVTCPSSHTATWARSGVGMAGRNPGVQGQEIYKVRALEGGPWGEGRKVLRCPLTQPFISGLQGPY